MLTTRFLTDQLRETLSKRRSENGFELADVLRSGTENPDSNIGAYAGDASCYEVFSELFDQVIEAYHGYTPDQQHYEQFEPLAADSVGKLNLADPRIISTRIRVGRNIKDYPFPPSISHASRLTLEAKIATILNQLTVDQKGRYYSLSQMSDSEQRELTEQHYLFKKGDRFLESAGVNRDWPSGRGIFYTAEKKFLVWVNEEDHLRIISMQQGGAIATVYERLRQAVLTIGAELPFARNNRLGYLCSCPTNLGTAMRASVHIKLPRLGQSEELANICKSLNLSVRGIHGEHSESKDDIWDISNTQRLGISEIEVIKTLFQGVKSLLQEEDR